MNSKAKKRIQDVLGHIDLNIRKQAEEHEFSNKLIKDKNVVGWGLYNTQSNELHRYYLYIKLKGNDTDKILTVLMLNPSNTFPDREKNTLGEFDATVSNVIKIAQETKYSALEVINLFSYIEGDSKKVTKKEYFTQKNKYYEINKTNNSFLKNLLNSIENPILIAWGEKFKNTTRHKQVKELIEILKTKNIYTFCKKEDGECKQLKNKYPKHPGRIKDFTEKCIEKCHKSEFKLIKYIF